MTARGKREARRPWLRYTRGYRPERPKYLLRPFRAVGLLFTMIQARRASRLRLAFISRAFGALCRLSKGLVLTIIAWRFVDLLKAEFFFGVDDDRFGASFIYLRYEIAGAAGAVPGGLTIPQCDQRHTIVSARSQRVI